MSQAPQVKGYEHDDAWDTNWLRVDETHELYYEQYGKRDGKAGMSTVGIALSIHVLTQDVVIYLHGGPGGHISKGRSFSVCA